MRYGQNMFVLYLLHFWANWGVLGLVRKPTDPSRIHSSSALYCTLPYPGVFPLRMSQLSSPLTHLFCFLIALVMRTYKPVTKPICRLLISLPKHLRSLSDSALLTQRSPFAYR